MYNSRGLQFSFYLFCHYVHLRLINSVKNSHTLTVSVCMGFKGCYDTDEFIRLWTKLVCKIFLCLY